MTIAFSQSRSTTSDSFLTQKCYIGVFCEGNSLTSPSPRTNSTILLKRGSSSKILSSLPQPPQKIVWKKDQFGPLRGPSSLIIRHATYPKMPTNRSFCNQPLLKISLAPSDWPNSKFRLKTRTIAKLLKSIRTMRISCLDRERKVQW